MEPILTIDNLNSFGGNMLRQGDKSQLKYRLRDVGNKNLNISGKSCQVKMYGRNYTTVVYETTATVSSDNAVSFTINKVLPKGTFYLEFTVGDYIFPTDHREFFEITPSGKGTDVNVIEIVGKDVLIREVKSQVDTELQPLVTFLEDSEQAEAQRVLAESERSQKYASYAQQFNDVITDLSEEKDYHSLPEISGARGGHETLGQRLDETDAQLAQTDVTHHQMESVKSLPVGSKGGSVKDFEYKGQTLVNMVKNGDFSDGLNGWELVNARHDSENNFTFTGNLGFVYQNIPTRVDDKVYIVYDGGMVTEAGALSIRLAKSSQGGDDFNASQSVVVLRKGDSESGSTIINVQSDYEIIGFSSFPSPNLSRNVELNSLQAFNLTQTFGAGNEPIKEEMDAMIDGYIDGMQSAKADVKTVGKNLFDKTKVTQGYWVNGNGEIATCGLDNGVTDFIPVAPNTEYRTSGNPNTSGSTGAHIIYYDGNFKKIDYAVSNYANRKFKTPDRKDLKYLRTTLRVNNGVGGNLVAYFSDLDTFQLEEGTTTTEYEPYKSSTLTAEPTLHRLPNGVADRVFEQDGEMWLERNVGEHVVVESDVVRSGYFNNLDVVAIDGSLLGDAKDRALWDNNRIRSITIVEGWSERAFSDDVNNIGTYFLSNNAPIKFCVEKDMDFSQFKADLAGTKIIYQLETPELINLTEQGLVTGELMSYANGTSYNNGSLKGEVSFKVPASTGAQITSLVGSSERQAKQISVLSDHVAQLISGV